VERLTEPRGVKSGNPVAGPFAGIPASAIEGIAWPALPAPAVANRLALMQQLEQSQWWPPDVLRDWQFRQLGLLCSHALKTSPFYRKRLGGAGLRAGRRLNQKLWAQIPLLTREDIQDAGDDLLSTKVPANHGQRAKTTTSGSTGKPVTVVKTGLGQVYWESVTLRNHIWQRRDLTKKLAVIRSLAAGKASYPRGVSSRSWGGGAAAAFPTGPAAVLNVDTSIAEQARWLQRQDPDYLLTLPTNLLDLANACIDKDIKLPRLRDVGSLGGVLMPRVRAACRAAWDVGVVDIYSAQEVGYIALQCPDHEHYHVQSETCLVEILDSDNRPCEPGQTGRVVVTPLHSFAMPLLRYDIGDYAEVGEACSCGRGLPVLRRIIGRTRNMLIMPGGERVTPTFINDWFEGFPVRQFQAIQRSHRDLEIKIVPLRAFTEAEERRVKDLVAERLGTQFQVSLTYHEEIARGPGGKFEDFKCEIEDT